MNRILIALVYVLTLSACEDSSAESTTENAEVALVTADAYLTDTIAAASIDGSPHDIVIAVNASDKAIDYSGISAKLVKGEIGDNDSVPAIVCDITVTSTAALENAVSYTMTPGQTVCLAAGTYHNLALRFGGSGSAEQPITVAAAVPGEVVIRGDISVAMSGEYVVLQGFIFRDGIIDNTVIQTRGNGNVPCNHCRITEISMIDMDKQVAVGQTSKWVYIYGAHNRVDHSWFSGKTARGALLVVDRYAGDVFDPTTFEIDYAQIDHNYFGDRAPVNGKAYADSSDNEYEGIRLGTSDSHTGDSYSVVEHNYFERIQGEAEVISNKAGHNIIRHNTIRDSYGSIVTRHGEYATITNNFIIGDDHPFSGGIRVVDGNHTISNNYIQGARYKQSSWNGGIVLTSGNGSTSNGYQNVENVLVAHNTIVDSVNSLNFFGGRENTRPDRVFFVNNIVVDAIGPVIKNASDLPTRSVYAGNRVYGTRFSDDGSVTSIAGMTFVNSRLTRDDNGLLRPGADSPDLSAEVNADIGSFAKPSHDMDGQLRSANTLAGADEASFNPANRGLLTAELVGPLNYTPPKTPGHVVKVNIINHDFDDGTTLGWRNNGAVITTVANEVFSRGNSLKFDNVSSEILQTLVLEKNTYYTLSAFAKGPLILGVDLDGNVTQVEEQRSDYGFVRVAFNSGLSNLATIFARMDNLISRQQLIDGSLTAFRANSGNSGVWMTVEDTATDNTLGDVGSSSNSATSTDGSAKLGYTRSTHNNATPSIKQTITNIAGATDYNFSFALLVKNGSTSTATLRIEGDRSVLVDDIIVDYSALEPGDLDDRFRSYTQVLKSGDNTELTVSVTYNAHPIRFSSGAEQGVLSSATKRLNELRVDNVSLTREAAPAPGTEAFFDSFRLVSHKPIN